jgi:hypothetical protein
MLVVQAMRAPIALLFDFTPMSFSLIQLFPEFESHRSN